MKYVFVAWCVGLSLPSHAADENSGRRIAILIGANNGGPSRQSLKYAHTDAHRLADALRDVSGFSSDNVTALEDPDPAAVLTAMDALNARPESPPTLFVFYFSGHASADALFTNGHALAISEIRERLERSGATLKLGIVDSCSGGGWTRAKGLTAADPHLVPVNRLLTSEGTALLSSSSGLEKAHEADALKGSLFTHHLVAAMRGAAAQPNGEVTLQGAFKYAEQRTVRDSALFAQEAQHPSYALNMRGRQDVLLAQIPTAGARLEVTQAEGPIQLIELPGGTPILELPPGRRRVKLAVPSGTYLLKRAGDDGVAAREVTVGPGGVVDIEEATLTLVGDSKVAMKSTDDEIRKFELSSGYLFFPFAGSSFAPTSGAVPTVNAMATFGASYAFTDRFGARLSLGIDVAIASQLSALSVPAMTPFAESLNVLGLGVAEGFWTPLRAQLGSRGRLELSVLVGTGLALTNYRRSEFGQASSNKIGTLWAPLKAGASLRFMFGTRIGANVDWTYFFASSMSLPSLQAGVIFAF
jgi:uncharacterized caspase-like protein